MLENHLGHDHSRTIIVDGFVVLHKNLRYELVDTGFQPRRTSFGFNAKGSKLALTLW